MKITDCIPTRCYDIAPTDTAHGVIVGIGRLPSGRVWLAKLKGDGTREPLPASDLGESDNAKVLAALDAVPHTVEAHGV